MDDGGMAAAAVIRVPRRPVAMEQRGWFLSEPEAENVVPLRRA
jgi:hypothetical protein